MDKLIKTWDGETVITRFDSVTETWMFIAIHSTSLGIGTGGTRYKHYPTPQEALQDAMRLAEGMTYKWAGIGFPRGGGKAVIGCSKDLSGAEKDGLLSRYGAWLSDLKGIFETGPDMGTTPRDMDLIRKEYPGIFGCTVEAGGMGDPGPYTALGVFSGIQASCERVFGSSDLSDRSVLVQGVGSVGEPLIRYLVEAGCKVRFSDVDPDRIDKIHKQFDLETIDPEAVYAEPCDVFAPCATGGILNADTIPTLSCSIVAGGANNQLAALEDADALKSRAIVYAPDFIINAGGALYLVSTESMGWTEKQAHEEILKIGGTLTQIYTAADEKDLNTSDAAVKLARDRIQKVDD
jgi:leucine dehydrogenase